MAVNERNPAKGVLVCDTCYKRKVKCDRQNPCRNCVAAKTPCQWTRQIPVRRRKPNTADAVRTLEHKVHHLESLLRQSDRSARADCDDVAGADYMEEEKEISEPESSLDHTLQQDHQTATANGIHNPSTQPLRLIDALVRVREAERIFSRFKPAYRERESEALTSTDILNAMTRPSNDPADFISHPAVNKIGLTLLSDCPIPTTEKAQYQTILLFKAALALGQQVQTSTPDAVTRHIQRIQIQKFQAALTASDKIGTSPSLSLLQAQCVKVAILQFFGDVVEARNTMGSLSRTLVALGYNIAKAGDEEVMNCVKWCYRCDTSMSVFARLPRVLPALEVDVSKELLYSLQDRVLHLASLQVNTTQRADIIAEIDRETQAQMQKDTNLDFRVYATLTLLWHSHPGLSRNSHVQTILTGYARETLKLLIQLSHRPGLVRCEADITLHWDILCTGVLPILILSVHILCENSVSDFELVKTYTSIVSNYNNNNNITTNHLATQVHQLCISLLQTCEACSTKPKKALTPINHTPFRKNFMNFDSFFAETHPEDPDDDSEKVDAMVAEILTLHPKLYIPYIQP